MYEWVPAGVYTSAGEMWIYVRFGKTGVDHVHYREISLDGKVKAFRNKDGEEFSLENYRENNGKFMGTKNPTLVICPDREIIISLDPWSRPLSENYDICLETTFYKTNSASENYTNHFLVSAHNAMEDGMVGRSWRTNKNIKMIGDSGGSQLKRNITDYIDPMKVIDWYNKTVDIGTSLDLPPRPLDQSSDKVLHALACGQKKNNEIFLKHKNEELKLLNIVHGFTLKQARDWVKTVEMEGFSGWGIGTDSYHSEFANLQNVLLVLLEHKTNQHLHMFGVGGKNRIPYLAWLGKQAKLLTSDSTSHLMAAQSKCYLSMSLSGNMEIYRVGRDIMIPRGLRTTCNCELCKALGWWEVFHLEVFTGTYFLLAWHNMTIFSEYARMFVQIADECKTVTEYNERIQDIFEGTADYRGVLDYIDLSIQYGLESSGEWFKPWMGNDPVKHKMKTLFQTGDEEIDTKLPPRARVLALSESTASTALPNYLTKQEMKDLDVWEDRFENKKPSSVNKRRKRNKKKNTPEKIKEVVLNEPENKELLR